MRSERPRESAERGQARAPFESSDGSTRSQVHRAPFGYYRSSLTGKFLTVNPALAELLGYDSPAELLALDLGSDVYRNPAERTRLIEQYRNQERWTNVVSDWKRKDGSAFSVRLSGRPVRDEHGAFAYFEGVVEKAGEPPVIEHKRGHVQRAAPAEATTQPKGRAEASGGSETVLLVEDEEGVRRLAREFLKISGYTVLEAGSGSDALEVSSRHEGPIHLMVTDVVMPGMSGLELAQSMRVRRPEMKVIYMSGYTDNAVRQDGAFDPGTIFLQKPFPLRTLVEKVGELLTAEVQQQL